MKTTTDEKSHSEQQAIAQLESIREMIRALDKTTAAEDWAGGLTREQCVKILTDEAGIQCYDREDEEILREAVAVNIADGTIEPDGFEFDEDEARQRIQEDPLSVEVRSGWHTPGDENAKDEEFTILLCTGGPAVRLIGELDEHGEPESVRIQHQDWGTPWTEHLMTSEEQDDVLTYCREFLFAC